MSIILATIGFAIGYNISIPVDKMILWKEKQNDKKYALYRNEYQWDKWINGIIIFIGMIISFRYFILYKSMLTSIILILAVFATRLDQRVRIIPNELVLVILVIGIINRLVVGGLRSLVGGVLALFITGGIFFLSAFITRLLSGSLGIGAGDIKLAMVLSLILGLENLHMFLLGIVLFLLLYVVVGLLTKTMWIGSSFPMCTQIMGGCVIAMYEPITISLVGDLSNFIG